MKKAKFLKGNFLLGHLLEMQRSPLDLFKKFTNESDFIKFKLGPKTAYLMNSPELIKEVFVSKNTIFQRKDVYNRLRPVLGKGLLTTNGTMHKMHRRIMTKIFRADYVEKFLPLIQESIDHSIKDLINRDQTNINISDEYMKITLSIIFKALFGDDYKEEESRWAFNELNELVGKVLWKPTNLSFYLPTISSIKYHYANYKIHKMINKIIDNRLNNNIIKRDFLGLLMATADDETGTKLTRKEIRDHAITFAFAGHETTASTLMWATNYIIENPEWQEKIANEGIIAKWKTDNTKSSVQLLLEETLRMRPAAWFLPRTAMEDTTIADQEIKKGDIMMFSPYMLHRHPKYWKNPNEFKPERFNNITKEMAEAFLPFGLGPNTCIGNYFAQLESIAILSSFVSNFKITKRDDCTIEKDAQVTLRSKSPLYIDIQRRDKIDKKVA